MPNPLDRDAQWIADSSEEREHVGEHGVLVRELCRDGVREHLPGACVGPRVQGRLRLHLLRQHHPPPRMVQLGRPIQREVCYAILYYTIYSFIHGQSIYT